MPYDNVVMPGGIPTPPVPGTANWMNPGYVYPTGGGGPKPYMQPNTNPNAQSRRPNAPDFSTPAWWKEYKYSGAYDPNAELAMTVNALLPSMSPIDRRYWSSWLYQQDPAKFAGYSPDKNLNYGSEGDEAQRGAFTTAKRASDAWDFLQKTLLGTGDADPSNDKKIEDMGAAVPWLQRVMDVAKRYAPGGTAGTGADRRTRAQERAMQSDLTSLWSEGQSSQDLQPYLELAKRFIAPSYETAPISTPTPAGFRESAYTNNPTSYSRMNFVSNPRYL